MCELLKSAIECPANPNSESHIGICRTFAAFRYRRTGSRKSSVVWVSIRHPFPALAALVWLGPLDIDKWEELGLVVLSIANTIEPFTMTATGIVGTSSASMKEFKSAGFGAVGVNGALVILLGGSESTASAALGAAGAVDARTGSFTAANINPSRWPSADPVGGIAAFTASATGTTTTRTVTIDGVTVWITADGRRWFKEPVSALPDAVPAVIRVSGAPALDEPRRWLRRGGDAPWSGLSIGGRVIESLGVGHAAAA